MLEGTEVIIRNLESKQSGLLKWCNNIKVTNEEEQSNVEDINLAAKGAIKEALAVRKSITAPMDEAKKRTIQLFQPYIDRLELGVKVSDRELNAYHAQVVAQQEEERMLRLAEEAARIEELQEEAEETGEVVEPQVMQDIIPIPLKTHHTNLGSVTYREGLDIAIVNPNLVPRDLCEPSLRKIKARAESGITNIPGVVITKKYTTAGRHS